MGMVTHRHLSSERVGIRTDLATVASWLGIHAPIPRGEIAGVSIDTRTLQAGNLFVALRGPHHDGHHYLAQAAAAGAVAAIVEQVVDHPLPQLRVVDTHQALTEMARQWRICCATPIIAVTGSNGKTTVKEMCASIMGQMGRCWATPGNLNNEIGVPLTLLQLEATDECAVIEMGANHAGEIKRLTAVTQPQVALITNASTAHLAGFGSLEGVAHAKAEIYSGLAVGGTAVVNLDDPFAVVWLAANRDHHSTTFGINEPADIHGEWQIGPGERSITTPQGVLSIELPLPGRHNLSNALAAIAATQALGAGLGPITQGLQQMQGVAGRLQRARGVNGATLIDDSYNANPASLRAGIEVLVGEGGTTILALGDMGELGDESREMHRQAGREARALGVQQIFATGELVQATVEGFGRGAQLFAGQQQLIEALQAEMGPGVRVLVKGSRSARMDRVVNALLEKEGL